MKKLSEFIKNYWFNILIFLIGLLGVYLRVHVYLFNRSLWMDEAALANNLLLPHSILNNMTYAQAAPPLFKLISLINIKLFGESEYIFRLFPMFCGILSIPIFWLIVKRILNSRLTQATAMTLFSINYLLIYYSSEFKQYSTDVLCGLCLLFLTLKINLEHANKKTLLILSLLYAFSFWFSHAALFTLFSIFTYYLIFNIKEYKKITLLFSFPAISFIAFWFLHLKTVSNSTFMHEYWVNYFINSKESFITFFNETIPMFFYPNLSALIILTVIIIGTIVLIKSDYKKATLILLPTILLIILSFLNVYPFAYRLALFLLPLNIIYYTGILLPQKNIILTILSFLLFITGSFRYINYYPQVILKKNIWLREELRTLYEYMDKKLQSDDIILSVNDIYQQNKFYQRKFKFKNTILEKRKGQPVPFDKMEKGKRYMVIYNQYGNKQPNLVKLIKYLNENTKVLSQYVYYQNYLFYVEKL